MTNREEWTRLNGRHRTRNIRKGLQARMADPYWMLTRQWQFGEFKGDDAANPATAKLKYQSVAIDHFHTHEDDSDSVKTRRINGTQLLEPLVERERVTDGPANIRISAEAALQFIRRLPKNKQSAAGKLLRELFPLNLKSDSQAGKTAFLKLLAAKSFDAQAFLRSPQVALRKLFTEVRINKKTIDDAFKDWSAYNRSRFDEPTGNESAWRKDRLEYRFGVSSGANRTIRPHLSADEYAGGRLDWHSFDLDVAKSRGLDRKFRVTKEATLVPTPVRYSGMPADRFWDFEEGEVFFGGLSAGSTDLAQMILTEFATVYSNDWYMLPVTVDTGTLTRITSIEVKDSFGESQTIQPAAALEGENRNWRFFELTGDPSAENGFSPWLYIPRTLLGENVDRPVEKVIFSRDEMANLAWGIEETIEGQSGHRISRRAEWLRHRDEVESYLNSRDNEDSDAWTYRLLTTSPPHWVPFIRETKSNRVTNRLIRGRMAEWDLLGELKEVLAGGKGKILDPSAPMHIQEEEIPQGAIEVTRSYQAARDTAGNLIVWCARQKRPSSRDRASGRQTDKIEV